MSTQADNNPQTSISEGSRFARIFLPRLCIAFTLFIMLIAAGEVASYSVLRHKSPSKEESKPPAFVVKSSPYSQQAWRERFITWSNLQYRAFSVWRRPEFNGEVVHVDADGLRRTANSDCAKGTYTVWMFGSSTLWGANVADWETVPSLLAKRYQQAGRKVCVKNYGEDAWVSTQEVVELMLRLKSADHKPDLVMFYDGVSDSFLPLETDAGDVHGNYAKMQSWFTETRGMEKPGFAFLRKSNTFRVLQALADKLQRPETTTAVPTPFAEMAQRTITNYQKNMEIVKALSREFGFRYAFFWQPSALAGGKPFTHEEEGLRKAENEKARGAGRIFGATYGLAQQLHEPGYFYLGDIFENHSEQVYDDVSHVCVAANELIADKIFRSVESAPPARQVSSQRVSPK